MKKVGMLAGTAVVVVAGSAVAFTQGGFSVIHELLNGYKEVPVISTTGSGNFNATINKEETEIEYRLSYKNLEGTITQSHIHFAAPHNAGPVSAFLCTNLGNGPAGTPTCPTGDGWVDGVIDAADVLGPTGQGIEPGAIGELIAAIRAGTTYVNVHTTKWPAGEIRSQIEHHGHGQ